MRRRNFIALLAWVGGWATRGARTGGGIPMINGYEVVSGRLAPQGITIPRYGLDAAEIGGAACSLFDRAASGALEFPAGKSFRH